MADSFQAAAEWMTAQSGVTNESKLKLYALYKIATTRQRLPSGARPSFFDFEGRAKYDSWKDIGASVSSHDEAEVRYVELAELLGWRGTGSSVHVKQKTEKGSISVSTLANSGSSRSTENTLHDAAAEGDLAKLRSILEGRAQSVDSVDEYGFTALHLAADRGHANIVRYLLEHSADRSIRDPDGNTAEDLAFATDRTEIVRLLEDR